ncbi:MAG: o-succinylbenzoate synthase [Acidimicrobiales bacterium]
MRTLTEHRIRLPLRIPLGGVPHRNAILLEGPAGWGEWSPLPGYPSDPAVCRRAAEEAATTPWPMAVRSRVRVNALIPAVSPATAAALAVGLVDVKVKVGVDVGSVDVDRVAAVRDAIGPHARLRVDANGAWDVDKAISMIERLAPLDLELVEQPVASLEDLAAVRRRVTVPVAADESVRNLDDARRLAALGAADALVVKVQPLGGIAATLEVIAAAGVAVIVSSMYETSVGLAAGLALAAALDQLPFACGLGTAGLFVGDVVADPLDPVDGWLTVRRPVPDVGLLARYGVAG